MDNQSIYNKIKEVFGSLPQNYNVLEEQIDIDLQMEYFDFSKKIKKDINPDEPVKDKDNLFIAGTPVEEKKRILVSLASLDNIDSYRTIERYVKEFDDGIKSWAILALQESRMLIQSKLLDENQVFISTGLGGKGSKLRYFIVLISKDKEHFSAVQQNVIKKEMSFQLKKNQIEVEEVQFFNNFSTMVALIPIDISIKDVFKEAIDTCNEFGDFLRSNFIVTNVKRLNLGEIQTFLEKHDVE